MWPKRFRCVGNKLQKCLNLGKERLEYRQGNSMEEGTVNILIVKGCHERTGFVPRRHTQRIRRGLRIERK